MFYQRPEGEPNLPASRVNALDFAFSNQAGGPTEIQTYNIHYFLAEICGYLCFSRFFRRRCYVTLSSKKQIKGKRRKAPL